MRENIDKKYLKKFNYIVGVDEVGRGPLCGPVVSCAVILPKGYYNSEIDDSKKLSEKKRESLYKKIIEDCVEYQIGVVEAEEIDKINILNAARKSMVIAIKKLKTKFDFVLSDCMNFPNENFRYESFIKGDAKSQSIAAASIIAKVFRDHLMINWDKKYPQFNFKKNKGYGTKDHLNAISKFGIIPRFHRISFSPVKKYSNKIFKK